jgi:hypothetical protein
LVELHTLNYNAIHVSISLNNLATTLIR